MSVKDIKSQIVGILADFTDANVNGDKFGASIDTADYGEGILLCPLIIGTYDGAASISVFWQESSDNGASDPFTDVIPEKVIGDQLVLNGTQGFDEILGNGLLGNKRYVRPRYNGSGVVGSNAVFIFAAGKNELVPS